MISTNSFIFQVFFINSKSFKLGSCLSTWASKWGQLPEGTFFQIDLQDCLDSPHERGLLESLGTHQGVEFPPKPVQRPHSWWTRPFLPHWGCCLTNTSQLLQLRAENEAEDQLWLQRTRSAGGAERHHLSGPVPAPITSAHRSITSRLTSHVSRLTSHVSPLVFVAN